MVRRFNRLLVALHIANDAIIGVISFLLAYAIRFDLESPRGPMTRLMLRCPL